MDITRKAFLSTLAAGSAAASVGNDPVKMSNRELIRHLDKYSSITPLEESTGQGAWLHQFTKYYDVGNGMMYDRIRFAPGETIKPFSLFSRRENYPTNYLESNCCCRDCGRGYRAAFMPPPTEFLAKQVLFCIHPEVHEDDLNLVKSALYWDLWIGDKQFARSTMLMSAVKSDASKIRDSNGQDLPLEVIGRMEYINSMGGVPINSEMTYQVAVGGDSMTLRADGKGLDLFCGIRGIHARGVC